jgi:uncharacterized membrane protein (DUF373 family)
MHKFLLSKQFKQVFDGIFDLAIGISIAWLAFAALLSLLGPLFGENLPNIFDHLNIANLVTVCLNTLIMVKVYKLLYHFIGDHSIKLIDLLEIAITAVIIMKVFDHTQEFNWIALILLIILLLAFIWLHRAQKKKIISTDETSED